MTRNLMRTAAALAAAVALGACEEPLEVDNPNQPDRTRVLATPADAEALIGAYYRRWHDGLYRGTGNTHGMANVMAFQNFSSLANNCQNQRYPFTGAGNDNSVGNSCAGEQARVYFVENEVNRVASDFITQLDSGLNLGTPARNLRAKSFAEFLRGVSLGYIAMLYDSSAVISPTMDPTTCNPDPASGACIGVLRGYTEVMDSAHAALQRSIDYATTQATGDGGFPLPAAWIPSPTSFTSAEFVKLIRSYRARFRANVARNPTERAAAKWDLIIADAQAGLTADHLNITNSVSGPFYTWIQNYGSNIWHQMPPFIIGMADVSGSYAAWIAQPVSERGAGNNSFFMVTPDLRFPQGTSRAAQQADFQIADCTAAATTCERYFVNRAGGSDVLAGPGWGWSNYDWVRFTSWRTRGEAGQARNGPLVFFTEEEVDLLEAEGHYRNGNYAAAADLVNETRTRGMASGVATGGGLPPVTADPNAPVPGGPDCVPKVPVGPAFNTIACGNLWEALKYEKRIETAFTHYAAWFLDSRGWGDLAEGTPLFWAVPYEDLQVRGYEVSEVYSVGQGAGSAPNSVAMKGTYGW